MRKLLIILTFLIGAFFISFNFNSTQAVETTTNIEVIEKIPEKSLGERLIDRALTFIGTPYKWGATGPKSFDCSGFVKWIYNQEGIQLSRTSRSQYHNGTPVKRTDLKPGDLVFFARNKKSSKSIYHVGMVVDADNTGEYTFIHSTRGGVKVSSSHKYDKKFFGAIRIF